MKINSISKLNKIIKNIFFKKSFVSNFLIYSLLLILSIDLFNGYISIHYLNNYLDKDTIIVNKLGIIRGDIQRYVKLKISHQNNNKIEKKIDKTFEETCNIIEKKHFFKKNSYFFKIHFKAKKIWNKIKSSNNHLIPLSEKEWKITNNLTFYMQNFFNKKFRQLKQGYIVITISSAIFILILIAIIYCLIKKGLEIDTITDALTKLYNRAYFNEQIVYHIEKFNRNKEPFVLLLFDIDHFKKINDNYGHNKGDEILKELASILKKSIRKTDIYFRYGGEEFTVIFPNTKINQAKVVLDRFLENLKELKIEDKKVTVSGGMKEYDGKGMLDFIKEIDNALYYSKNNGRNKIKII